MNRRTSDFLLVCLFIAIFAAFVLAGMGKAPTRAKAYVEQGCIERGGHWVVERTFSDREASYSCVGATKPQAVTP